MNFRLGTAMDRRAFLQTGRAGGALAFAAAGWLPTMGRAAAADHGHDAMGLVDPPRPAPALPLTLHDGRSALLPQLLQGHITIVQLMFTTCSATCGLQGAAFASLEQRVERVARGEAQALAELNSRPTAAANGADAPRSIYRSAQRPVSIPAIASARLLSITIDPGNDDAAALRRWRERFAGGSRWDCAAPPLRHSDVMLDFLGARAQGADRHIAQAVLFDARGRLAFRCPPLAGARDLARQIGQLGALASA